MAEHVSSDTKSQGQPDPALDQMQGVETPAPSQHAASIQRIKELLKTKNDTSRFVGLALLKSVLDNAPDLQQDEVAVSELWGCIPSKFLDRLLKARGTSSASPAAPAKDSSDMVDIAVSVIHTFTLLLPEPSKRDDKLVGKIPLLVSVLLQSSEASTLLVLQTLVTLVSFPEGARKLTELEDLDSLLELAPSQPLVLDILSYAFLNSMATAESKKKLAAKVEQVLQAVISSFTGTDAVTLLAFLADFLRRLDEELLPPNPKWLPTLVNHVRNLTSSRPTAAARSAYVNLAATLLQVYPSKFTPLLFSDSDSKSEKPFSYLFINLLLIDLRSSFPSLLEQLNSPEYYATSQRLSSDFDVISCYVGYLMRLVDGDDFESESNATLSISPDLLLKIRKSMSEAMSVTIEFLRDRWDASVAGAMGLHPDARVGEANTWRGKHHTIAWDSIKYSPGEDPLILSAVRCLAIWLREDDNEVLRKEAAGLCDMLVDLYKASTASDSRLDFRRPVLVALEGITAIEEGVESLMSHDGWKILTGDLLSLAAPGSATSTEGYLRGVEIVRILLPIVENGSVGRTEDWLNMVTFVATWDLPDDKLGEEQAEFYVAALQLVASILSSSPPGVWRRYQHSITAVRGLANRLMGRLQRTAGQSSSSGLSETLDDVLSTLGGMG